MKRIYLCILLIFICSFAAISQEKNVCENTQDYLLDKEKPTVYLTFEHFGKATDWQQSKLGEWSDKSKIKKGNDVWLRLRNNSCWAITFTTDSLYISKTTVDGKFKAIFGVLEDGSIVNVQSKIEEQNRKQVSYGAHGGSLSSLPAGRSVLFGVSREHLENDRSIYVPFRYEWEKKQFSSNLEPMHRSFYWGYRLEEDGKK